MDAVSAALLAALASGAGGEAGRQAWAALTTLVRRPHRVRDEIEPPGPPVGEHELTVIEAAPADPEAAASLAAALRRRGENDERFAADLNDVLSGAAAVLDSGQVRNIISGKLAGSAVQGRDFSGPITFG